MIICAGDIESFDFAVPMGIGLIDTAMNVTRLCLFDKPEFILFIGTAGSYGRADILDVIESKTASNVELSFLQQKSYTPIDNVISAQTEDKKELIVNSSNYITTDEVLASGYEKFGIGIENMEFFSVVRVAMEFDIPVGGVFCVTNYCNANAHQDFLKNHQAAKEKLSLHVRERIKELTS